MTRGRGQPSSRRIDRDFPYQVLVSADLVRGFALNKVDHFHSQMELQSYRDHHPMCTTLFVVAARRTGPSGATPICLRASTYADGAP